MAQLQIIKDITLDFYDAPQVVVHAKQGDNGRYVRVSIQDSNLNYIIPSGAIARIASGTVWNTCTISENKILAQLTPDMLKKEKQMCQIELLLGDTKLTTVSFILVVEKSARDDGAIEGSNKFSVLDQTIKDAGAATTAANTAAANANSKATLANTAANNANIAAGKAQTVAATVQQKLDDGDFIGPPGPQGKTGNTGATGPIGPTGPPGEDGVAAVTALNPGCFGMSVNNAGHLIMTHNDNDPQPPLSIVNGRLIYTIS